MLVCVVCYVRTKCKPRFMVLEIGLHGLNEMVYGFMWDVRNAVCLTCKFPKWSVEIDSRNRT